MVLAATLAARRGETVARPKRFWIPNTEASGPAPTLRRMLLTVVKRPWLPVEGSCGSRGTPALAPTKLAVGPDEGINPKLADLAPSPSDSTDANSSGALLASNSSTCLTV